MAKFIRKRCRKQYLYQHLVEISHLGDAKAPGLNDRKWVNIDLILTHLRSFNPGAFASPKWEISTRCWYRYCFLHLFRINFAIQERIERCLKVLSNPLLLIKTS